MRKHFSLVNFVLSTAHLSSMIWFDKLLCFVLFHCHGFEACFWNLFHINSSHHLSDSLSFHLQSVISFKAREEQRRKKTSSLSFFSERECFLTIALLHIKSDNRFVLCVISMKFSPKLFKTKDEEMVTQCSQSMANQIEIEFFCSKLFLFLISKFFIRDYWFPVLSFWKKGGDAEVILIYVAPVNKWIMTWKSKHRLGVAKILTILQAFFYCKPFPPFWGWTKSYVGRFFH